MCNRSRSVPQTRLYASPTYPSDKKRCRRTDRMRPVRNNDVALLYPRLVSWAARLNEATIYAGFPCQRVKPKAALKPQSSALAPFDAFFAQIDMHFIPGYPDLLGGPFDHELEETLIYFLQRAGQQLRERFRLPRVPFVRTGMPEVSASRWTRQLKRRSTTT